MNEHESQGSESSDSEPPQQYPGDSASGRSSFRHKMDGFGIGFLCVDGETTAICDTNSLFLRWLGLQSKQVHGRPLTQFVHEVDRLELSNDIRAAHQNPGLSLVRELALVVETGLPTWAQFTFLRFSEDGAENSQVWATVLDITGRKTIQGDLKILSSRFDSAQEHSNVGSWEFDSETGSAWWSKQLYKIHRVDPGGGIPSVEEFYECIHPDDRQKANSTFATISKPGQMVTLDYRSNPALGEIRYFTSTVYLTEINGKLTWNGTTQDMSQQKQLEAVIEETEGQYRKFVESAAEGICSVGADLTIQYANDQMAKMVGYTVEELVGMKVHDLKDPESWALSTKGFQSRLPGQIAVYESKLIHKKGQDVWVLISASPLVDDNGDLTGTRGTVIDITDRKKMDEIAKNAAVANAKLDMLSIREREVFDHVVAGQMNKVIAKRLDISEKSVERNRSKVMKKLQVQCVPELVKISLVAAAAVH